MNPELIRLDVEPQQVLLGNMQTGLQIVASINMEEVIDQSLVQGDNEVALKLGLELLNLIKKNGSLIDAIDVNKHFADVIQNVATTVDYVASKSFDDPEYKLDIISRHISHDYLAEYAPDDLDQSDYYKEIPIKAGTRILVLGPGENPSPEYVLTVKKDTKAVSSSFCNDQNFTSDSEFYIKFDGQNDIMIGNEPIDISDMDDDNPFEWPQEQLMNLKEKYKADLIFTHM